MAKTHWQEAESALGGVIAYNIGLLIGEELRDRLYKGQRWTLYSGLFILLRHKLPSLGKTIHKVMRRVFHLLLGRKTLSALGGSGRG